MLERIVYALSFAVAEGIRVAFFGVDGTRADLGYFETVYKTAVEAGAQEVVVVDTIGIASPEAVAELVGRTREWVGPDVPVHFHGHNDFGLATASALAAARAGARWIHGTINGMGERAGNANLPEIALALRGLYGIETNLRLNRVREFSERLREVSGYALEPYKPLVGDNLFRRESGAVASQFRDPPAIEPYAACRSRARSARSSASSDRTDPGRRRCSTASPVSFLRLRAGFYSTARASCGEAGTASHEPVSFGRFRTSVSSEH